MGLREPDLAHFGKLNQNVLKEGGCRGIGDEEGYLSVVTNEERRDGRHVDETRRDGTGRGEILGLAGWTA